MFVVYCLLCFACRLLFFEKVILFFSCQHCKNYETLFARMSQWLVEDGLLFVHIFTCDMYSYHFEVKDETDWMAKHFFSGGECVES